MEKKNIVNNYTLEEYNKKYRNRKHRLLKYTKERVEDFDKQYGHYIYNSKTHSLEFNHYLLRNRMWALIDDTYYEIPKPITLTWFRNLSKGVQVATCLLGAGIVATAITVPVVILSQIALSGPDVIIDSDLKDVKVEKRFLSDGSLQIKFTYNNEERELDDVRVFINNNELKKNEEYTFKNNNVLIKKETLNKYGDTKITVIPDMTEKGPSEQSYLEFETVSETECLVKKKSGQTIPENLFIPKIDPITNRTVIGIAEQGFRDETNIKTIKFAKSSNIKIIKKSAFAFCVNLTSFVVPRNVVEICSSAFYFYSYEWSNPLLSSLTFESHSKLKTIGKNAFHGLKKLTSIIIPSSVETMEPNVFSNSGLVSAKFEDNESTWIHNNKYDWKPGSENENATLLNKLFNPDTGKGFQKNTIKINGDNTVNVGNTIALTSEEGVQWSSSDESKATVDENGVVTGVASGDVYIIAKLNNSVGSKKVTVQ